MAFQTRRDPLFDPNTSMALERRGRELFGIGVFVAGLLAAALMLSYTPADPSWMAATDAPVQNWLGRPGASVAAPLFLIGGWGMFGFALVLMVWGARFALHRGQERALERLIFAPIFVAFAAVYASTLQPGTEWVATHAFGLGGRGGDTVLAMVLAVLPLGSSFAVKLMSLLMAMGVLVFGAFVLGFTRAEVVRLGRFLLVGLVVSYAAVMTVLTRGASGTVSAARGLQERQAMRRAERAAAAAEAEAYAQSIPVMPEMLDEDDAPVEKTGLLARMPTLIKRAEPVPDTMPEPELVEAPHAPDMQAPSDARISAKITDVIKSRVRSNPAVRIEGVAPLTKGRGRGPVPLIADPAPRVGLPPEPPLTTMPAAPEPLVEEDDMALFEASEPVMPEPAPRIPTPEPRKVVQQPVRKPVQPSTQAKAEAQPKLRFEDTHPGFELPPLNLLENPVAIERHHLSDEALEENARMLENVLDDYGVKGEIVSVRPGPVVTMYELEPAPGLKASRVIGLSDDIARSMAALSARVSTVPGRSVIGIELPNENREKVLLREILAARDFGDSTMKLPLALGKDIGGDSVVANLAKMPHLLIAGTTGSGKSVAINTMILSLLYKLSPEECRLIMIDPKMLELSVYDGIPHLLSPVVTDPKKAVVALKWVVGEMEERYRKMSKMGVRNIDGFNGRVKDALAKGEMFSRTVQTGFDDDTGDPIFETEEFAPEAMPYIVVIVDEMADLMMVAGKEIEACIQRLAQMARASGIHLIMATQRPSVDVITGTIKANFPTRISFQVTSKIDSRTILGEMGAEQLLGMGDMLYMAGGAKITRCHGPFVSDEEVEEIVNHLKAFGAPDYVSGVVEGPDEDKESNIDAVLGLGGNTDGEDALYDQAVAIVIKDRKCSTSYIQRKLAIGYNKAARLVEQMEDEGVVSSANHVGKREILVPEQ
ncbi:DNA translocase FtsK [uncultured Tateyamaria sp.]|uniref:DNA translocase FtsK n=1 Tax=Tateyamaria sp. 1078 TaxID=3417464 RepID=UPI00261C1526|nr:DNA translocase FtsK [uncultured Tateyamaria sp.]